MGKIYKAMGLMSGTSLDGVDVSIIETDGNREFSPILDRYYEYDKELIQKILNIREKITGPEKLNEYFDEIKDLERKITIFHAEAVKESLGMSKSFVDFIGFHGQTIFHDSEKKITKQLGDGNLLSQLTKKKVVYNFRQNDLEHGGQGAPLAPIFHNVLANKLEKKFNLGFPLNILNIGGISNITSTVDWKNLWSEINTINAYDIGPGNCLIDEWIRKNSKKKYDESGLIARSGTVDKLVLNQALENFTENSNYEKSLDVKDFDILFAKGLSLENGAATITNFTAMLIANGMRYAHGMGQPFMYKWLVCGGGRKNKYLLECIKDNFREISIEPIDKYEINGDFVESQAFAYLAIRSFLKLPISFPTTTGCKEPSTGGKIIENF
jgi:anhydro-N-acetylmuramic acid kinase|tara:strand:- start:660 stop:1808 length:1149 start_codon:yes stop_codon:yes gene_type:complete